MNIWSSTEYDLHMAKKKAAELPPLRETLVSPDAEKTESTILKIDELWSFIDNKGNKTWI